MDEYDALLEEPFGEDIDWAAIDSMSLVPFFPPASTVTISRSSSNITNGSALSNASDNIITISSSSPPKTISANSYSSPKSRKSRIKETSTTKHQKNSEPYPCQCESRKPIKKRKYIQAIEDILECTICFNVIAAAYSLSCGHMACGLCLSEWSKFNGSCFICREPANGIFIPSFQIDRLAELYFKNKQDMNETEKEDYCQWQNRLEAGRSKMQPKRPKRVKSKKSTVQNPPRDRNSEGHRQRNILTNLNQPPLLDPPGDVHPIPFQTINPPPQNPVAMPHNPPPVNHPQRNRRPRHFTPIIITPEIITEEIVHVIPYHAPV